MIRFRYVRDPLFLMASAAYVLNRCVLKPHFRSPFLQGTFNDLLLIPAALPVLLWGQRLLGIRTHDSPPLWSEMLLHLVIWSLICEVVGPMFLHRGTADVTDVIAYTVGGVASCLWWRRFKTSSRAADHEL